jgi:FtsZ-interacting cell division protein ZipA
MNHTTLAIVGVIAIAALLVGAIAISTSSTTTAYAWKNKKKSNDDDNNNKNIDIEKSETNFIFKQKLKNNCSGFAICTNDATQTLR